MHTDERFNAAFRLAGGAPSRASRLMQRVAATAGLVVLAGAALMFSAVLFVVIAVLGTLAWGWLWWKTRALRRQQAAWAGGAAPRRPGFRPEGFRAEPAGLVLEGEVIREVRETGDGPR